MKFAAVFIQFLILSLVVGAQDIPSLLKKVHTIKQAWTFIQAHPQLHGDVVSFISPEDSSALGRKIFSAKRGSMVTTDSNLYKVLWDTSCRYSKVNYIFLSGDDLSSQQIDSIRNLITDEYKKGTPFSQLASLYSMDASTNGDLPWFCPGTMVKEFEDAVNQHRAGDLFTVNIPSRKWYYVVKKIYESKKGRQVVTLKLKNFPDQ